MLIYTPSNVSFGDFIKNLYENVKSQRKVKHSYSTELDKANDCNPRLNTENLIKFIYQPMLEAIHKYMNVPKREQMFLNLHAALEEK
jgi:hypothetical protein